MPAKLYRELGMLRVLLRERQHSRSRCRTTTADNVPELGKARVGKYAAMRAIMIAANRVLPGRGLDVADQAARSPEAGALDASRVLTAWVRGRAPAWQSRRYG